MKKLIWILIIITLMITGCNKKEDEIDAQTQEKLNKFDRIIADIKSYQKNNKREVGITIQDGIYIKDGERLNYYSVTALEGTTIADRVKIVVQIDKAPAESKVVIGNKLVAFNDYKDLETLASTGVVATTVISPDTIVYDVGAKIEETAVGGENKIVGYWAKYNTAGDNLEQVLFLTADCKIEYQNYSGDYFSTRGTYVTTTSKIVSTLEYETIDKEISYTLISEGTLKVTINGSELEFTRVTDISKIVSVKGSVKYKNGTAAKGKIIISTGTGAISKETTIDSDGNYTFTGVVFPIHWFGYRVKVLNESGKCIYEGIVDKMDENNGWKEITGDITNDIVMPVITEETAPAQETVTLIKEITDSSADENYSYPTAVWNGKTVFPQGILDIRALRVYSGSTTYEFEIEMGTDITQLWTGADDKEKFDRMLLDIYISDNTTVAENALLGRNIWINNGYSKVITISPYKRDLMKTSAMQDNMVIPFIRSISGNKIRVVVSKSDLGVEFIQNIQMLSMACEDIEYSSGTLVRTGGTKPTQWGFGGYAGETNAFDMLGTNSKTNIDMYSVGEVSVIGTWAKYEADGNLTKLMYLTSDGLLEYHNYDGTYFCDRGTYTYTADTIAATLEYNQLNANMVYTITDAGKLKITVKGTELEFTRVGNNKKCDVTGVIKYSDGTPVKGKIRLVTPAETIVQEKTIGSDGSYLFEDMAFPMNWSLYRVKVFNESGKCIYLSIVNRADESNNWAEISGDITNDIVIPKLEEEIIPAQEEVTLIKEITDSSNDELYSYPTAIWNGKTVFPSGLADIRALRVYSGSTTYEFEIEMGTSIEKLWNGTDREGYIDRILCDIYVSGTATGANTEALLGRNMTINNGYDKVITISPYTREAMKACALQENMVIPFVRSAKGNKIRIVVKKSSLGLESINNIQVLSMLCEDLEFGIKMPRIGATTAIQWDFGGYTTGGTNAFDMLGTNNKTNINMVSAQ